LNPKWVAKLYGGPSRFSCEFGEGSTAVAAMRAALAKEDGACEMNPTVIDALDKIGWPDHLRLSLGRVYLTMPGVEYGGEDSIVNAVASTHLRETLAKLDDTISIVPVSGGLWWEAVQAPDIYLAYTIVNGWHWTDADAHDFDSYAECAARAVLAVETKA
jgi:hypothetical protein